MNSLQAAITDYEYENVDSERQILRNAGIQLNEHQCKTEEELIRATHDQDGIIIQYSRITPRIIEKMERCKVIVRYGIGVDNIDMDAATAAGIYVCNVPDYGVEEVANHAMSFLLSHARMLPAQAENMRSGGWGFGVAKPIVRLSTCILGLIGFGRIPQQVCVRARAFGMRVLAYDPYAKEESIREKGAEPVSFEKLLMQSDYISCHCPLTNDTYHCIDKSAIEKMKSTVFLINTARGGIICEADLVQALKEKRIAGAALDVFEQEPLSANNELRGLTNVMLTGHAAWYSEGAREACQSKAAEEVARVLTGNPPLHALNYKMCRKSE